MSAISWARGLVYAFGASLVAAGFLKTFAPSLGAQSLAWLQCQQSCHLLVTAMALAEIMLGLSVIIMARTRLGSVIAAVSALSLTAIHLWGMSDAWTDSCGCFGPAPVPRWAVFSFLVAISCGAIMSVGYSQRGRVVLCSTRSILVATLSAFVVWLTALALRPSSEDAMQLVVKQLPAGTMNATCIVGSWSCDHCRALVTRLKERRSAQNGLFMVVRASDVGETSYHDTPSTCATVAITDNAWWALIEGLPPRLLEVRDGIVHDVAEVGVGRAPGRDAANSVRSR